MGKYETISRLVNSIFGTPEWALEAIPTYPPNFAIPSGTTKAIRLSIVASGSNKVSFPKSVSGQIIIDIFTSVGDGPKQGNLISDTLDRYISGKSITDGGTIQTSESTLVDMGDDTADKSLRRFKYSISFNYYGV